MNDKFLSDNLGLSRRALNCCRHAGIFTLGDLIDYAKRNKIAQLKNCGLKTTKELQSLVTRYADFNAHFKYNLFDVDYAGDQVASVAADSAKPEAPYSLFSNVDDSGVEPKPTDKYLMPGALTNVRRVYDKLNALQLSLVEQKLREIADTLSRRGKNAIERRRLQVMDILKIVCSSSLSQHMAKNCGINTIKEIQNRFTELYDYIFDVENESDTAINITDIRKRFTFLNDTEAKHVADYRLRRSHMPLYFLLWKFISTNDARDISIYARRNGYLGDPMSYYTLAPSYGLSIERVRQVARDFSLPDAMVRCINENRGFYHMTNPDFVNPETNFDRVYAEEFPESLVAWGRVNAHSLVSSLTLMRGGRKILFEERPYYISERFATSFDISKALKIIKDIYSERRYEQGTLPIADVVGELWLRRDEALAVTVTDAIKSVLAATYGAEVLDGDDIVLPQNVVVIEREIYKILQEHGRPMGLMEIQQTLSDRFPDRDFTNTESLRSNIILSQRISTIGKTSTYALKEWNINTLTIRDQIYEILAETDRPLKTRDIVDALALKGKPSSWSNVHASIYSDKLHGFVRFDGNFFGIDTKDYGDAFQRVEMRGRRK